MPTKSLALFYLGWGGLWVLLHITIMYSVGLGLFYIWSDVVVYNIVLVLVVYTISNVFRFYNPGYNNFPFLLVWALVLATATVLVFQGIVQLLFRDKTYLFFVSQTVYVRGAFSFILISFLTLIHWLWYFIKEQKDIDAKNAAVEKLAREAELNNLREQLQPHFLFNSLNSINALIGSNPLQAREMVHQLSSFLRGTLRKEGRQLVLFKDEIQHLQLYLDIEKVRFGHRLNVDIEHSEKSMQMQLPALMLQPLVENAIKFGLYDTLEDSFIKISAKDTDENMLVIRVENPYDPLNSFGKGTGFGLSSVQRRLYLLYARNDLLKVNQKNNTFVTTIKIPQK